MLKDSMILQPVGGRGRSRKGGGWWCVNEKKNFNPKV